MCKQCEGTQQNKSNPLKKIFRKKLWDLKAQYHCAIIGTCLSMAELKKIIRQSGFNFDATYSDYDLHSMLVTQAETKSRASRNTQKMLDKKYARFIQLISRCKSSSKLESYWRESLKNGDMAGLFWAILTHPYACNELIRKTYEDIHMLSHIQGASNRVNIQRLQTYETQLTQLQETLSKTRQNSNEQLCRRVELIQNLENENRHLKIQLSKSNPNLSLIENNKNINKAEREITCRLEWTERQLAERDIQLSEKNEELQAMKELLYEARKENLGLEVSIQQLLSAEESLTSPDAVNLKGQKILYLGGRKNLTTHMRSLVSNLNGEFAHHDGGVEESRANLQCALASADMVFCPIDCISHDACLRAKQHCQQADKRFVPLRSSGISAFSAGLQKIASESSQLNA